MSTCKSNNSGQVLWKEFQAPIRKMVPLSQKISTAYLPAVTVCTQRLYDKKDFSLDFNEKDFN